MKSSFSLVIINYNGKALLRRCLHSAMASAAQPAKIIVVDDGSTDGSAAMVRAEFPTVTLLRNAHNRGPTAARNRGARAAVGDFILFCDNDVRLRPTTCGALLDFLRSHPRVAVCGARYVPEHAPKLWWNMGHDPNNFRESVGYCFGALLRRFPRAALLKRLSTLFILNYWDYDRVRTVDWVSEACFMVRRDAFRAVGGLDEAFVMFFEGPDLCKRLRRRGWRVAFHPAAAVDLGDAHTHTAARRECFFRQSKAYFYRKHYFPWKSNPFLLWLGNKLSAWFYRCA